MQLLNLSLPLKLFQHFQEVCQQGVDFPNRTLSLSARGTCFASRGTNTSNKYPGLHRNFKIKLQTENSDKCLSIEQTSILLQIFQDDDTSSEVESDTVGCPMLIINIADFEECGFHANLTSSPADENYSKKSREAYKDPVLLSSPAQETTLVEANTCTTRRGASEDLYNDTNNQKLEESLQPRKYATRGKKLNLHKHQLRESDSSRPEHREITSLKGDTLNSTAKTSSDFQHNIATTSPSLHLIKATALVSKVQEDTELKLCDQNEAKMKALKTSLVAEILKQDARTTCSKELGGEDFKEESNLQRRPSTEAADNYQPFVLTETPVGDISSVGLTSCNALSITGHVKRRSSAVSNGTNPIHKIGKGKAETSVNKKTRLKKIVKQAKRKKIFRVNLENLPQQKRRQRNPEKSVSCLFCQRLFCDYTGVDDHVKKFHTEEADFESYVNKLKDLKQMSCEKCKKIFSDRYTLHNHENKEHSNVGHVMCHKCEESFDNPVSLRNHVRTVHVIPAKRFSCTHCPATFKWSATLMAHEQEVHKGVKDKTCDICGKVFHRQSQLNRHKRVHSSDSEKLICSICQSKFNFQANLKRHMTSVHGPQEEKFHCSYCGRGFAQKSGLWPHIENIHFPMQAHPCGQCNKVFHHGQALKSHMNKIHQDANFELPNSKPRVSKYLKTSEDLFYCSACKESFYYKSLLFEHMHTAHADAFPFQCKECPQGFLERSFLIIHKHKAHKIPLTPEEKSIMKYSQQHSKSGSRKNYVGKATLDATEDFVEINSGFVNSDRNDSSSNMEIVVETNSQSGFYQIPAEADCDSIQYGGLEKFEGVAMDTGNVAMVTESSSNLIGGEESQDLTMTQIGDETILTNDGADILVELASIDGQNVEFVLHRTAHMVAPP